MISFRSFMVPIFPVRSLFHLKWIVMSELNLRSRAILLLWTLFVPTPFVGKRALTALPAFASAPECVLPRLGEWRGQGSAGFPRLVGDVMCTSEVGDPYPLPVHVWSLLPRRHFFFSFSATQNTASWFWKLPVVFPQSMAQCCFGGVAQQLLGRLSDCVLIFSPDGTQ